MTKHFIMNSVTDKISVKKFNDFLENEQTSRAFSRLAERKLKNKTTSFLSSSTATVTTPITQPIQLLQPKFYKYTRDELIEISRNPRSKMTKKEFIARLKNPDLDEKIILSFQRKEQTDPMDTNDITGYRFPMKISSRNNLENPENGGNIGQNSNNRNEKGYRFSKYDYDSNQSWRTDRYSQDSRGCRPSSNRSTRRMTKYNDMKRYDNGGRDFYSNEPEPEWFSDGPKSMTDFIDLKGFDDDCNNNDINNEDTSSDSCENNINNTKKNDDLEKDSTFLFSDISKDDFSFSSFLDSTSEEFSHITGFEKSRSERWFKSRFSTSSQNQDQQEQTSTASCNSLIDLFQKQNIDINNFSYHNTPKMELSSAVNVSELEASFVDKENSTDTTQPMKKEESSLQNNDDNDIAILSKLKFLANNNEQQQDDKPQPTDNIDLDTRPFLPPQPPQMSAEMFKNYFLKFNNSSMAPMNSRFITDAINNNQFPMNNNNIPRVPMFFPGQVPPPHNPFLRDPNNPHAMLPPMPPIPHSHPFYMHRFLNSPMFLKNPHFINQQPPNMPLNFTQNMENPFARVSGEGMKIQPQHFIPGNLPHSNNQFNEHQQLLNEPQLQQESSVAHKLLKNSKFTPTSVFRKLKDQSVNKPTQPSTTVNKSHENFSPPPPPITSSSLNIQSNHNIDQNQSVEGLQSFLKQLNLNQSSSNESSMTVMPPSSSKLEPNSLSLSNTSKTNSENSKSLNPNDIFNVFKAVNNNSNNNPVIAGVEFPPLPLMNALKVEDIEKS